MVMVRVDGLPPEELCRRLQAVSADEVAQTGRVVRVLLFPWAERSVRAVWHRGVSAQDTELALGKWAFVLRTLRTDWEDPLEKDMTTHSRILFVPIPIFKCQKSRKAWGTPVTSPHRSYQ